MVIGMKLKAAFGIPAGSIALCGNSTQRRTKGRREWGLSEVKCDVRLHSGVPVPLFPALDFSYHSHHGEVSRWN